MKKSKLVIGVTGPIASGKNEVCRILRSKGFAIIDADGIGHDILKRSTPFYKKVIKAFGEKILKKNGEIDRDKLGAIVFRGNKWLKKLNAIAHSEIRKEIKKEIKGSKSGKVAVNAALVIEMNMKNDFDKIISVLSDKGVRTKRLIFGRKMTPSEAQKRIAAQKPDDEYKKISDLVITNNGSLKELAEETEKALKTLKAF